jgi:hypothetical protein
MRKLLVLLAGLAVVVSLHAQVTGISGTVINADTRQPIVGATVCCYVANTHTDSAGAYLIANLQPGKYRVRAIATGFQTGYYPESVLVVQGRVTPDIDFALVPVGGPNGGISGRVRDANTQAPIRGATITAHGPNGNGTAQSESCGGYLINGLPAGKYRVCAQAQGYQPGIYPESVTVTSGQVTPNINFALVPAGGPTGGISGRVFDANTQTPIRGAVITAQGPNGHGAAQSESCGGYIINGLPAGEYRVCAQARGYQPGVYSESVVVVGGQVTPRIDFPLVPTGGQTGGIAGFVTNAQNGQPIFGALVTACGPSRGSANTCQRGGYSIRDLLPGIYAVQAAARGFLPSPVETVAVVAGQTTPNVNFALHPEGGGTGGISGVVMDSAQQNPVAGATLFAWGPAGQGQTTSDSAGNYLIQDLRTGSYSVRACARGYYPAIYPESVHVVAGQTTPDIVFALRRVGDLDAGIGGFVYDGAAQMEIAGATVTAIGVNGSFETQADAYGDYVFDRLTPGEYQLTVTADGYGEQLFPEPVVVEAQVITALVCPALYPFTGLEEAPARAKTPDGCVVVGPNPFRELTTVHYSLARPGNVSLKLYNIAGKLVTTLIQCYHNAGASSFILHRSSLSKGVYLLQMESHDGTATTKLILQ